MGWVFTPVKKFKIVIILKIVKRTQFPIIRGCQVHSSTISIYYFYCFQNVNNFYQGNPDNSQNSSCVNNFHNFDHFNQAHQADFALCNLQHTLLSILINFHIFHPFIQVCKHIFWYAAVPYLQKSNLDSVLNLCKFQCFCQNNL